MLSQITTRRHLGFWLEQGLLFLSLAGWIAPGESSESSECCRRSFWMPFIPSMRATAIDGLENSTGVSCRLMRTRAGFWTYEDRHSRRGWSGRNRSRASVPRDGTRGCRAEPDDARGSVECHPMEWRECRRLGAVD